MITLCSIKGIAYQVNDPLLAGKGGSLIDTLNNFVALNYGITGNQSAKIYANQKRGEFTPFAKGEKNHLCKGQKSAILQGLTGITTRDRIEFFESIKKGNQSATLGNIDIKYRASQKFKISNDFNISKGVITKNIHISDDYHLRLLLNVSYSDQALAKSSVRIGVLNQLLATHDAPSVFFCVHAYAHLLNAVLYRTESMVAAAEQPKGWLDSSNSSNANSTVVTTPEIGVSSGDSLTKLLEIIVMMATLTQTQFKFLFLSIKRSDTTAKPCRIAVTASNEHDARLMLVRDYILAFAGRVPVQGVTA